MPFSLLRSIANLVAPQPVQRIDDTCLIETINDCGEKRYIELEREFHNERKKNLDVLLTKCKRLLSFVETTSHTETYTKLNSFIGRVHQAVYKGDDITPLFEEFYKIENSAKKGSKTFSNLSDAL